LAPDVPAVKAAANYAARILAGNYTRALVEGVSARHARRFALAAYNAGFTGAMRGYVTGDVDANTAHGNYSRDTKRRVRIFKKFLDQPPRREARPTVELDATALVSSHGPQAPRRIVLHSTESYDGTGVSDLYNIASYWRRQGIGLGAHLTIDSDGNTARNIADAELGYHVKGRNTGSLGIEQIGFARFSKSDWLSRPAQLEKVSCWLAYWSKKYDIPLVHNSERGVSTHWDQSQLIGGGHWDPGFGYPLARVLAFAKHYKEVGCGA
jgi:hypothetical protein